MKQWESLKQRLASRAYLVNGYCNIPSPFVAELYARQGWDCVTLDMEHGSIGFDSAVSMLQAIHASGAVPLVRIPAVNPALIGALLDAGAMGITCAMIQTADQAKDLVRACKYPPQGGRSLSRMSRAALVYGSEYHVRANSEVNVFAMIETAQGLENLDAITAVEGIDGIYVGSVDMAMSVFGRYPPLMGEDPEITAMVQTVIQKVASRCAKLDLLAGMNVNNVSEAQMLLKQGFRFITFSSDLKAMMSQTRAWIDGLEKISPKSTAVPSK